MRSSASFWDNAAMNWIVKKMLSPLYHKVSDIEPIRVRADRFVWR